MEKLLGEDAEGACPTVVVPGATAAAQAVEEGAIETALRWRCKAEETLLSLWTRRAADGEEAVIDARSARAKLTAVTVTASAPAKLMLYGEHAVVYGVPCVVTAVDLRVRVSVALRRDDRVTIRTPMLAESFTIRTDEVMCGAPVPPAVHFVVAALRACWQTTAPCGLDLHTRADFSHSYGLGSSSAVTVATVKALGERPAS